MDKGQYITETGISTGLGTHRGLGVENLLLQRVEVLFLVRWEKISGTLLSTNHWVPSRCTSVS